MYIRHHVQLVILFTLISLGSVGCILQMEIFAISLGIDFDIGINDKTIIAVFKIALHERQLDTGWDIWQHMLFYIFRIKY